MTGNSKTATIINAGKSPVILTGPHNGWIVPDELIQNGKPLGVEPYWFDPAAFNRRHEACDWGMQDLFDVIEGMNPDICLIAAQYSRLVVDLNRIPSVVIYEGSSETGEDIPGNMHLDNQEKQRRLERYYHPYHSAVDDVIKETKEKFGSVLWIDMHSFTPTWQGQPRTVGIGSLKLEKSEFVNKFENLLEDAFQDLFVPDQPYDLGLSPFREINGGGLIAERNGLEYFGLEIRNDLLSKPNQNQAMAEKLLDIIENLR